MPPNTSHKANFSMVHRDQNHDGTTDVIDSEEKFPRFDKDSKNDDSHPQQQLILHKDGISSIVDNTHSMDRTRAETEGNHLESFSSGGFNHQYNANDGYMNGGASFGSALGGMSPMYGGYGSPYASPYGGMFSPVGMGISGPLSNLNQFLFGVQSLIFSLGQAVQIIGMNTQALKQLFESVTSLIDSALKSWNEMRILEVSSQLEESEEGRKKRRRLKAFRWAIVAATSYLGYRIVRRLLMKGQSVHNLTSRGSLERDYSTPSPAPRTGENPCPRCGRLM